MRFVIVMVVTAVLSVAPLVMAHAGRRLDARESRKTREPAAAQAVAGGAEDQAETALVRDLMTGVVPAATYRDRMAALAARDAERNPLVVPLRPGDWPASY